MLRLSYGDIAALAAGESDTPIMLSGENLYLLLALLNHISQNPWLWLDGVDQGQALVSETTQRILSAMSEMKLSGDVPRVELDITSDSGGFGIVDFTVNGELKSRMVYIRDDNEVWFEMWNGGIPTLQPLRMSGNGVGVNGAPPAGRILINTTSSLENQVAELITGLAARGFVTIDIPTG